MGPEWVGDRVTVTRWELEQVRAGSESIPSWPRSNQDRPITDLPPNLVLPTAPREHLPKVQALSPFSAPHIS